jgi:hypothetical protein
MVDALLQTHVECMLQNISLVCGSVGYHMPFSAFDVNVRERNQMVYEFKNRVWITFVIRCAHFYRDCNVSSVHHDDVRAPTASECQKEYPGDFYIDCIPSYQPALVTSLDTPHISKEV